jgi:hypothetical protein
MIKLIFNTPKGFAVLGAVSAVFILAALAFSTLNTSAVNQSTRTAQLHMAQSFYSAHAGIEYALRQIRVDGDPDPLPARDFAGEPLNVTYTGTACSGGRSLTVVGTKGRARNSFSIGKSRGPDCLRDKTHLSSWGGGSNAELHGFQIKNSNPICHGAGYNITGATISWTPNGGERLKRIQIHNGPFEYDDAVGLPSGSHFDFGSNDYNLSGQQWRDVVPILFDSDMSVSNPSLTIIWFIDGKSQCYVSSIVP